MRRVVVTGLGLVTPLGVDVNSSWNNLIESKSGIKKISRFDTSDYPCKIAGEVDLSKDVGFNPDIYINPKDQKKMDLFIQFGFAAAVQAVEDSGWEVKTQEDAENTGVIIGSGIGGLNLIEENALILKESGIKRISPFFIPASLINLTSGHISMKYGFMGANQSQVTACATGSHAIGDAFNLIKFGMADVMVAGGSEAAITKLGVAGFCAMRAMSTNFNDQPEKASRPWDKDRDGFVMGEGGGVLVLEEYEHAVKRGAKIYAEIVGYGSSGDAYHITTPHPEGKGAILSIKKALQIANLSPDSINYVNAHATSTQAGDLAELEAIYKVFPGNLKNIFMSGNKSSMGHLLGATGSVEAIFTILAIKNNILPPTLNLENPPDDLKVDLVPNFAKEKEVTYALSNSFGFGGTNSSLIFKKI